MAQDVLLNTKANNIFDNQTQSELARYYHAAMWSPTKGICIKAIKAGFLKLWPRFKIKLISKRLEKLVSTSLGHLHQKHSGVQAIKKIDKDINDDLLEMNDNDPD